MDSNLVGLLDHLVLRALLLHILGELQNSCIFLLAHGLEISSHLSDEGGMCLVELISLSKMGLLLPGELVTEILDISIKLLLVLMVLKKSISELLGMSLPVLLCHLVVCLNKSSNSGSVLLLTLGEELVTSDEVSRVALLHLLHLGVPCLSVSNVLFLQLANFFLVGHLCIIVVLV